MTNQNKIRFPEHYVLPHEEAHGNFHDQYVLHSKVSQGSHQQTNLACKLEKKQVPSYFQKRPCLEDFAPNRSVKIVDLRLKPKSITRLAQNEIKIWNSLKKNDHVVSLFEVRQEFDLCFMVMEMCSVSLLEHLSQLPVVDERALGKSFVQMLRGIEFLHNSRIVHRDIRPDNFVVGGDKDRTIKLCNFNLATVYDVRQKMTGDCGTALFMAPEMARGDRYDMKVDIWSFGVTVYGFMFGRFPYDVDEKNSSEVKHTIANTKDAPSFRSTVTISPAALAFTMSLLQRHPRSRPVASQALKKHFMIQIIEQHQDFDNCDLPNLKDQLQQVKQLRAFQNKELLDKSEMDDLLNRQQLNVHGLPLPDIKQQSIVVSSLGSRKGLEATQAWNKRNRVDSSGDSSTRTRTGSESSLFDMSIESDAESCCSV